MNRHLTILALLAAIIFIPSCQQPIDDVLDPVTIATNRVKTYNETLIGGNDRLSNTYNITYDDKGRVTAMIDSASPADKFVYNYPSASVYTMDIYEFGAVIVHADFLLNSSQLVDSTIHYNETGDTTTEGFTYNANNQLLQFREYTYSKATGAVLYNTTNYTYGSDGNLMKSEDTDGQRYEFQYFTNLSYIPPLTIGPITSASSKKVNLVKTVSAFSRGTLMERVDYTYIFDDKNRISIETGVFNTGGSLVKTYTY